MKVVTNFRLRLDVKPREGSLLNAAPRHRVVVFVDTYARGFGKGGREENRRDRGQIRQRDAEGM